MKSRSAGSEVIGSLILPRRALQRPLPCVAGSLSSVGLVLCQSCTHACCHNQSDRRPATSSGVCAIFLVKSQSLCVAHRQKTYRQVLVRCLINPMHEGDAGMLENVL